jgi:hypothetical protein
LGTEANEIVHEFLTTIAKKGGQRTVELYGSGHMKMLAAHSHVARRRNKAARETEAQKAKTT